MIAIIMTVSEYNDCVDQFSDNLFRFILKNLRDEDRARDIVQDSFMKLWDKVKDVKFEKAKSWLFSTGYNRMIDIIRKESRSSNYDEVPEVPETSHSKQYSDLNEILHEAVNRLPDLQRSVVMLRDYEGDSYKEIGEITELNEAQVKVYIFRARKFLKEYLGSIEAVLEWV